MNAHPNYPYAHSQQCGRSPCAWWSIARDSSTSLLLGKPPYTVSLGSVYGMYEGDAWCATFPAVVDDFGNLRRIG